MEDRASQNARDLERELAWFTQLLDARFKLYFDPDEPHRDVFEIEPPSLDSSDSPWAEFLRRHDFSFAERAAIVLALLPHVRPQLLDVFFTRNATFDRPFSEFGGIRRGANEFVPTGDSLAFILGANDLKVRFVVQSLSTQSTPLRESTSFSWTMIRQFLR